MSHISTNFESSQNTKKTFVGVNDKSCENAPNVEDVDVSEEPEEVVCQDIDLPDMVKQAKILDEGFIHDTTQLVQLSETILQMFGDSN